MTDTYLPSQDTATLARALSGYSGERCLEIGFGSGVILAALVPRFGTVVGTDIVSVRQAVSAKGEAEAVLCDRATCFRPGCFDLVAFNPPYLPSDGIEDRTVDGGIGGIGVPIAFLEEALRVLKPDGSVVLLLSNESDIEGFERVCAERGLSVIEKARTELFFESLFVFEVRRP